MEGGLGAAGSTMVQYHCINKSESVSAPSPSNDEPSIVIPSFVMVMDLAWVYRDIDIKAR